MMRDGATSEDDVRFTDDASLHKLKSYARSLPYSIEPNSRMLRMLDFFCTRIVQCVRAQDYDPGFLQWDSMLA